MEEKSNPFRFTLLFNKSDARHQRAVEILNQQGKSKSQYIVTALLHYVDCTRQPVEQAAGFQELQALADRIIRETSDRVLAGIPKQFTEKAEAGAISAKTPSSQKAPADGSRLAADRELLEGSMSAFRSRK